MPDRYGDADRSAHPRWTVLPEPEQHRPRYAGTMYDVFPGGWVSYRFDFERGAHIPLMAQLQSIVGFVPRQQLRLDVQRQLGVRLDP